MKPWTASAASWLGGRRPGPELRRARRGLRLRRHRTAYGDRLAAGSFRARFEDKGRLAAYLKDVPTSLVLHPYPALIGAGRELGMMERL